MSSEMVPFQRLNPSEAMQIAVEFAKSGYFADAKQASQTLVKILAGQELGISPFQAVTGIHIIQGKPQLSADLLAKLVKRSGVADYEVIRLDETGCELQFTVSGKQFVSSFTAEDARKAKLQGENYGKFPRNMYFARAMSNGVKWFCPHAIGLTVYTEGEIEEKNITPGAEPPKNITPERLKPLKTELRHMTKEMRAQVYALFIVQTGRPIDQITEFDADELERIISEVRERWVEPEPELSLGDELRIRYHAHGKKDRDKINTKYLELAGKDPEPIQTLWASGNEPMLRFMEAALNSLQEPPDLTVGAIWDGLSVPIRHKISKMYVDIRLEGWPEVGDIWVSQHEEAIAYMQEMIQTYGKDVGSDTNAA